VAQCQPLWTRIKTCSCACGCKKQDNHSRQTQKWQDIYICSKSSETAWKKYTRDLIEFPYSLCTFEESWDSDDVVLLPITGPSSRTWCFWWPTNTFKSIRVITLAQCKRPHLKGGISTCNQQTTIWMLSSCKMAFLCHKWIFLRWRRHAEAFRRLSQTIRFPCMSKYTLGEKSFQIYQLAVVSISTKNLQSIFEQNNPCQNQNGERNFQQHHVTLTIDITECFIVDVIHTSSSTCMQICRFHWIESLKDDI